MLPSDPQIICCVFARCSTAAASGSASLIRSLVALFLLLTVCPEAARADESGTKPDVAAIVEVSGVLVVTNVEVYKDVEITVVDDVMMSVKDRVVENVSVLCGSVVVVVLTTVDLVVTVVLDGVMVVVGVTTDFTVCVSCTVVALVVVPPPPCASLATSCIREINRLNVPFEE